MRSSSSRSGPRPVSLLTSAATAVAVAATLVLAGSGQASTDAAPVPRGPVAEVPTRPAPARSAPTTRTVTTVELDRHRGTVTGDGFTVYVANRTRFRPRRDQEVRLPPRLRGRSWVAVDLDSGAILGKHRARRHLPQASTMKLLTAVTAVHVSRLRHRVTRFEANQVCSCAGLRRGFRYRRATLLAGALLPSGNDAAEALAGSHPRGRRAFYRAMNRRARIIGATDTVARNASGLTATGSHSSARDLVLLLRAALREPRVAPFLSLPSAQIETVAGRFRHTVRHGTDYVARYPDSAGKSGWTTPAKNTLAVVTEIDGRRIAVATMGVPSGSSTRGARRLTLWAARNAVGLRAVGRLPGS